MSFLFPLYLLGAAALAIPILLHLRRRPPKEHIEFSSHLFLEKTPERLTRRTRLEKLLLLALRCLAILLLAFAFGRPYLPSWGEAAQVDSITRAVILLDRSASLQREDLWQQSIEAAVEAVELYDSGDEVAFAVFDESFALVADFPAWATLGKSGRKSALKSFADDAESPSWLGTDLGDAMTAAADLLVSADSDRPAGRREVVVISDFQDGARRTELQSAAWPEEVLVRPVKIAASEPANLTLNLAATPPRANVEDAEVYRVRVRNAEESEETQATLSWKGFPDTSLPVTVAPGTSRIVTSAPRPEGAEEGILVIEGDDHPFDNEIYVSPVQARPLRILFLSEDGIAETAGSPLFYLQRALQPTPILEPRLIAAEELSEETLEKSDVIIVADAWKKETGLQLAAFAEKGGLVIALPSEKASPDTFTHLTGNDSWKLSEASVDDYALLADLNFDHPVLQPFARAQIRDFTKVRFWKHRLLELPNEPEEETRVLATFDGESPALIERTQGEGALFVFLSGWEPQESQLALSSKFVPLLFSLFEHSGFSIRSAATLYVGETDREKPGFYTRGEEGGLVEAINLEPTEGNVSPFDPAVVFPDWGIPLVDEEAERQKQNLTEAQLARLASEEKEENQKLWKWLILGALILLLIESILSGRPFGKSRGRTRRDPAPAATPAT
ncbi:MAG: BatA domain-containing protein [Verrucomicrobiales bacterium]|nr:BatA domain-containing protein [Verrucomicrobiales bacterium]